MKALHEYTLEQRERVMRNLQAGPIGYQLGERVFYHDNASWDTEWRLCWLRECVTGNYWHAVDIDKKGDYSGLFTIIPKTHGRI